MDIGFWVVGALLPPLPLAGNINFGFL